MKIAMKSFPVFLLLMAITLSSCENKKLICTPDTTDQNMEISIEELQRLTPVPEIIQSPSDIEIGGKSMTIDKLVNYPLCNDHWSGTVYVDCGVTVASSELDENENPLFLDGCNLIIEPGTIVYVAAHNDTAYYKGCSCHTGEEPVP